MKGCCLGKGYRPERNNSPDPIGCHCRVITYGYLRPTPYAFSGAGNGVQTLHSDSYRDLNPDSRGQTCLNSGNICQREVRCNVNARQKVNIHGERHLRRHKNGHKLHQLVVEIARVSRRLDKDCLTCLTCEMYLFPTGLKRKRYIGNAECHI